MKTEVIPVEEFLERFCKDYRTYNHDGKWYVFRNAVIGDGLTECQYGMLVKTGFGNLLWFRMFHDIP